MVGLIVNPVAGMGGSVGLKGTDGDMYERALELGATPVTPERTRQFLAHLEAPADLHLLAAPGPMGADVVGTTGIPYTVVGTIADGTSPADTKRIAQAMVSASIDLLVFVGGDGTARDICDAIGASVPVVGVPGGVKTYSAVFAVSPRAAAELVTAFLAGAGVTEEEVMDIDEEAFRHDRLATRLYGSLLVPDVRHALQRGKEASGGSLEERKRAIAARIVEDMDSTTLYFLGPGTTVRAIADEVGLSKTLLGVDAVYDRELVAADVNERNMLQLMDAHERCKIIVTPLGGNGFIFGRGNKQFTPTVIRRVGRADIIVVSTPQKLRGLDCLRVDTGDPAVDEALSGYMEVWTGYRRRKMMPVCH